MKREIQEHVSLLHLMLKFIAYLHIIKKDFF